MTHRVLRITLCLLVAGVIGGLSAPAAQARTQGASSSTVRVQQSNADVQKAVCGLLGYGVRTAAKKLVSLVKRWNISFLASALVTGIATKAICRPVSNKLNQVLNTAVRQEPKLKARIGPFAFGLYAVGSNWNARYNRYVLHWRYFQYTTGIRANYLWYHFDRSTQWYRLPSNGLVPKVARGHTVQFALRVQDNDGLVSPWVYSVSYNDY